MININELRIGNLVDLGKIEQIDNSIDEVYYSGEGFYQSTYCCNLNPIQLTDKWLLKFNFEFELGGCRQNWTRINLKKVDDCYLVLFDGIVLIGINYVHQFQNIYFALVGSELPLLQADA